MTCQERRSLDRKLYAGNPYVARSCCHIAILGAMVIVAAVATAGTREIAHRPNYDLAMNTGAENPFTNTYGGTWSYTWAESLTGERSLMDVSFLSGGISGIARYPGNVQSGVPWMHVNRTGVNVVNVNLSESSGPPFYPLEMDLHPGYGNVYVALRFTCPRTAAYRAPFEFQNVCKINGKVRCFVLVNGVTKYDVTLDRSQRDETGYVHASYDLPSQTLNAGDTIEVVMHNVDGPSYDATVVRTAIYETVDDSLVADASEAYAAAAAPDFYTNNNTDVFTNANNVAWQFYVMNLDDRHLRSTLWVERDALSNIVHYVRTATNGLKTVGARRTDGGYGGSYPYLMVNTNGVAYHDVDAGGNNDLLPGELMLHPNTLYARWGIPAASFRPERSGFYDLRVNARSMNQGSGNGVEVAIYRDGDVLGRVRIGRGQALSGSLSVTNIFIFAREIIDVVVDPLGDMAADGTALRFTAWKVRDGLPEGVFSANAAMYANVSGASPSNPYTDADGATWCFGWINGAPIGEFQTHQSYRTYNNGIFRGWTYTTGNDARPYTFINTEDRMMQVIGNFSPFGGNEGRGEIASHQLLIHPGNNNVFNVVRFTAPVDGIYDVRSCFRHLNTVSDGISAGIIVRNQNYADWAPRVNWVGNQRIIGSMNPESLYLKEGDEVGLAVGPGPSGKYNNDLSGLEAFARLSSETEPRIVGIDFNTETSATFAGAGRIGWTDGMWNGVKLSSGAAGCKSKELFATDGSTRTGVTVEIVPGVGHDLACAAGSSGNALLDDGVVGDSSTEICTFTIGGLLPGETYALYLYATQNARFTVGGTDVTADRYWFSNAAHDHAQARVAADANGKIVGTFRSYGEGQSVKFSGIQVAGTAYAPYIPRMTLILFR